MNIKLKSSLLAGLATLTLLFPCASSTLPELAKPYLGAYECELATLGSKDLTEKGSILLELQPKDKFVLYYQEKEGKKKSWEGTYRYDGERETITFTGAGLEREFPVENGSFTVHIPVCGKRLVLRFKQK